ncbi:MAG: tRNA lysidine(34) synthetase TilS [Nitrospira sp.]|nr:tRNA lysidine(34) synthetase TilS [Nitrospira sp.]
MTAMASHLARGSERTGRSSLLRQVVRTIRSRQLIEPGQHLLVAVSGGPDSMALLSLLHRLRPSWRLTLTVIHCNYGLRGEESDGDQDCVEAVCSQLGLPLIVERLNVDSRPRGMSLQSAARELRYEAMRKAARACGADRIALGHTADDQAETVLLWILRGAGLAGLSGMPVCRDGLFIRPLYETRRREVLAYLRDENVPFRIDSSNQKPLYLRNRIRHEIVPALEHVVPSAVQALCRLADLCAEDNRHLDRQVMALCSGKMTPLGDGRFEVDRAFFKGLPRVVQRRVVRHLCQMVDVLRRPPRFGQVEAVIRLANGSTGFSVRRLGSAMIVVERTRLWSAPSDFPADFPVTFPEPPNVSSGFPVPVELPVPGTVVWPATGHRIEAHRARKADLPPLRSNRNTIAVDAARISEPLTVRGWKPGDRFCPLGMGGRSKKLQDFFTDLKISASERRCIPIVEAPEGIVWVVGHRQDDRWSVDEATEWCVVLHVRSESAAVES